MATSAQYARANASAMQCAYHEQIGMNNIFFLWINNVQCKWISFSGTYLRVFHISPNLYSNLIVLTYIPLQWNNHHAQKHSGNQLQFEIKLLSIGCGLGDNVLHVQIIMANTFDGVYHFRADRARSFNQYYITKYGRCQESGRHSVSFQFRFNKGQKIKRNVSKHY